MGASSPTTVATPVDTSKLPNGVTLGSSIEQMPYPELNVSGNIQSADINPVTGQPTIGGTAYNGGTTAPPRGQEGNWMMDVSQGSATNGQWIPRPSSTATSAPSGWTVTDPRGGEMQGGIGASAAQLNQMTGANFPAQSAYNTASAAATAPTSGWNVNTAAAQGLQSAMAGTQAEMGYRPMQVQAPVANAAGYASTGYNPATMAATGYGASNAGATGYQAAQTGSQGYRPATMSAGQLANTNLSAYMNPYESSVIGGLQSDALRGQQMASNQLGAQATAAKAFGGSRQAIAEGQMAGDIQNQLNNQIAGLRQSGYQNAQQMALADIQNRMTAGQTNVNALNQAGQFGAQAANTAALANQAALNTAGQFGAGALNTAALQNAAAQNAAKQFTAGAMNTAAGQNQAAINAAGQFGAGAANTAAQYNAGAQNAATLANQQAMLAAQQYNQNAGLAGSQQRLNAASQMGNLSNLGFGMGQTLNNNLAQQGALQQALQQMVMDKAAAQYSGYQQSPYTALSAATSALGATPYPQTSQTTQQRGLFDYLGMGLTGYSLL